MRSRLSTALTTLWRLAVTGSQTTSSTSRHVARVATMIVVSFCSASLVQGQIKGEFQVDAGDWDNRDPVVAMHRETGEFVVVWQRIGDLDECSGYCSLIFGQRYDAEGNPQGEAFQVSSSLRNAYHAPDIAMADSGEIAVVWRASDGIRARVFDFANHRVSSEQLLFAQGFDSDYSSPSIAYSSEGHFIVAVVERVLPDWQPWEEPGEDDYFVRGQFLGLRGQVYGPWLTIGEFKSYFLSTGRPGVEVSAAGEPVVIWHQATDGEIYGQRLGVTGVRLGSPFQVGYSSTGAHHQMAIARADDDTYVATWNWWADVYTQRFDAYGRHLGSDYRVPNQQNRGYEPDIALASDGQMMVVWHENSSVDLTFDTEIHSRRLDPEGRPVGRELQVNLHTLGEQRSPKAATDRNGRWAVVWESDGADQNRSSIQGVVSVLWDVDVSVGVDRLIAFSGGFLVYSIRIENHGESDEAVRVEDHFPTGLDCYWRRASIFGTTIGHGTIAEVVEIPAGWPVEYEVTCTISEAASGSLVNSVTVSSMESDVVRRVDSPETIVVAEADVWIEKTNDVDTVVPGQALTYQITVGNNGPEAVQGATVRDLFPDWLGDCVWACRPRDGAVCDQTWQQGDLVDTVDLPVDSAAIYLAVCLVDRLDGSLSNTATVSLPAGRFDPFPSNNAATDTETVGASDGTGALGVGRQAPTLTLLQDGRVLAVGGQVDQVGRATEIYDPASGTWSPVGPLSTSMHFHTASFLPSGDVLAVGELSTERFDPATDQWIVVGSFGEPGHLSVPRTAHTATVFPSGDVLVAGGRYLAFHALDSVERFDAVTRTWETLPPLTTARCFHTTTLLDSGELIVIGGAQSRDGPCGIEANPLAIRSIERFDPLTRTWAELAVTLPANYQGGHQSTLLPSGEILITGGALATALRFDPATETLSETQPVLEARYRGSATLLPTGHVVVAGGITFTQALASAEVYDPAEDSWARVALREPRWFHGAALLPGGTVLLVGGNSASQTAPLSSCEILDLGSTDDRLLEVPEETFRSEGHTLTELPTGEVLLVGGHRLSNTLLGRAKLLDFNPSDPTISETTIDEPPDTLRLGRLDHSATLLTRTSEPGSEDRVLVVGGQFGAGSVAEQTLIYDRSDAAWTVGASPSHPRYGHTATLLGDGRVLIVGGRSATNDLLTEFELYDPEVDDWLDAGELDSPREGHTATLLRDGRVLVVGGVSGGAAGALAELYDPETRAWLPAASPGGQRHRHTATLLPSGMVLVAGGQADGSLDATTLISAELYDPVADSWSQTDAMDQPRAGHTATLLASGRVLVLGGELGASAEIYDPATGSWKTIASPLYLDLEDHATATLPTGELVILDDRPVVENTVVVFDPSPVDDVPQRPTIDAAATDDELSYIEPFTLTGSGFFPVFGATSDGVNASTHYPLVQLQSVENDRQAWLVANPRASHEPETTDPDSWILTLGDGADVLSPYYDVPPVFDPGWHWLRVVVSGAASEAKMVYLGCDLEVGEPVVDAVLDASGSEMPWVDGTVPRVPIAGRVRFQVGSRGGRNLRWQRNLGSPESPVWVDLPGATGSNYTTPPVSGLDSGSQYRARVESGCADDVSDVVDFIVDDANPPDVRVSTPSGGEYWQLSTDQTPQLELIAFEVSDATTWVCELRLSLIYSNDGGATWSEVLSAGNGSTSGSGELPRRLGEGGHCPLSRAVTSGTVTYAVPSEPPSGQPGSLYKIRLEATDHAGNVLATPAESENPFFIVAPDDESIKTLVLAHPERHGVDCGAETEPAYCRKLRELADHPLVSGVVVDLGLDTDLEPLYEAWDAADTVAQLTGDTDDRKAANTAANSVLFAPGGIQQKLVALLEVYSAVESVMLIGGDTVIPLARIPDRSGLLRESAYTMEDALDPAQTPIARAIAEDTYLSDDPLAALIDPVAGPEDLKTEGVVFIPDLMIGRLVETPDDVVAAISTFQRREGVLALHEQRQLDRRVLVTGYDFLKDSANIIHEKWRCTFAPGAPGDPDGSACRPAADEVKGLIGDDSETFDKNILREALCGPVGAGGARHPYRLISLNGHANHYREGVPGPTFYSSDGLDAAELGRPDACGDDTPLDLQGAVIYAVGCHGGLPVADHYRDPNDPDSELPTRHPVDLPQVFLARGALAYVANSGYGWALKEGVGYSERLLEIFTDQLRIDDSIEIGEAVRAAKLRYYQEARGLDAYGIKTIMQWTVFGFPMARLEVRPGDTPTRGSRALDHLRPFSDSAPKLDEIREVEHIGPVTVRRTPVGGGSSGLDVIRLSLSFDPDSFDKRRADGRIVPFDEPCPVDTEGCYYTLNGLGDRASGETDRPIQPYFVYDSRLSGTSQHGVLWLGGSYREEASWKSIFAELVSNTSETGDNHGTAPQLMLGNPIDTPLPRRSADLACRVTDEEINTMVIPMGEVRQGAGGTGGVVDPSSYTIQRRYRDLDLEVFYYNDLAGGANCDRQGPQGLEPGDGPFQGDYHAVTGSTLTWQVPIGDPSEVWRVVVVYDARDDLGAGDGEWQHIELAYDDDPEIRAWTASQSFANGQTVTYVIQAVDRRGNVSWMRHVQGDILSDLTAVSRAGGAGPESGVDPRHPETVEVAIGGGADLSLSLTSTADPVVTGESFELVVTVGHAGGDPATAVEVEITPFEGSTVRAVGNARWPCLFDGARIRCERATFDPYLNDQILVVLSAPSTPGARLATASIRSAEREADASDNEAAVWVTVVEPDAPPQVTRVASAPVVDEGTITEAARIDVALTQLRIAFDEPVLDADEPGHYLLVEAGEDGVWQTESLALGRAGDDVEIPLAEVTYDARDHTAVLGFSEARPLPKGRYLLLAGEGIHDLARQRLDGDRDGSEGGDFRRTWSVQRQHRAVNPNFDRSLASWIAVESSAGTIGHHALDAQSVPSSGSLVIAHHGSSLGRGRYGFGQCIPVAPGEHLAFGGRVFLDPVDPWEMLKLQAEVWDSEDCTATVLGRVTVDVPSPVFVPSWVALPRGFIGVPESGRSLLLSFVASIKEGDAPAEIRVDTIEVYPQLFADGFEIGDTSRWSRTLPE